jgi:hypothetical protein
MDRNPITYARCHPRPLKMYFDGSLKLGRAGAGVLFISPNEKQFKYVLQILW